MQVDDTWIEKEFPKGSASLSEMPAKSVGITKK
jgi:hypothetical protein